ncbi:MAG: C4-dicarboxylate ABC transporter substrate-binding protein, partial [Acidobacteriota bacterium]
MNWKARLGRMGITLVILSGLTIPVWGQAPGRIKLATLAPRGSSLHRILIEMGQKWQKAGGPGLTIDPDGVKGGEAAMVRRMRTGELQAGMLTVVGLSEIDHSVTALQ